ncbi:hypothetical protein LguiA_034732 [Lonicera macranthoides]
MANNSYGNRFSDKMFSSTYVNQRNTSSSAVNLMVRGMGGEPKYSGTQMGEKKLMEMIKNNVMEAKDVCDVDQSSDECKVAWDEVEEVSQAKADLRHKLEREDPLQSFCLENPETDKCHVYED